MHAPKTRPPCPWDRQEPELLVKIPARSLRCAHFYSAGSTTPPILLSDRFSRCASLAYPSGPSSPPRSITRLYASVHEVQVRSYARALAEAHETFGRLQYERYLNVGGGEVFAHDVVTFS